MFIILLLGSLLTLTTAYARLTPSSVSTAPTADLAHNLSRADQDAWIEKAQNFLNGIQTMQARFIQVTYHPNNQVESRTGYLKWLLPSHIRFTYEGEPMLDVASDGVAFRQKDEDGVSAAIDIDSTPAGLILKRGVSFRRDAVVKNIITHEGEVAFILASPDDPNGATLTLVFKQNPCMLIKWSTREPSGRVIQVELIDPKMNVPLSKHEFKL